MTLSGVDSGENGNSKPYRQLVGSRDKESDLGDIDEGSKTFRQS